MAATLKHQTQRALSLYTFIDCDHPLQEAWSDYQHLKAIGSNQEWRLAAQKLRRELRIEAAITRALCAARDERRAA